MLYVDCRHCCYCTMWTSSTAKYFKLWFPKGLLPFFCIPVFSWIVESLCLVSMWKLWLFGCNSSMNSWPDLYGQYTGSTGFCQFWADGTAGHLLVLKISLIFFFFFHLLHYVSPYLPSSVLPISVLFLRRAWKPHLETPALKYLFGRDLVDACVLLLCSVLLLFIFFESVVTVYTIFFTCNLYGKGKKNTLTM